jgi:hypothetical protein
MPWLVGTALLHSAAVVEKREALKTWTILLAILAFSLSLLGTFLVRSGVLTSVHAFASDPMRGIFILLLLSLYTGGALLLFALRAPQLQGGGLFAPISREGGLLLNNLLLTTAAATILLGTLYPLLLDVVAGQKVSVGPPFFNMTFVPLMVPLLVAMAVGPLLPWKRGDMAAAFGRLKLAFALTAATAVIVLVASGVRSVGAACGLALAMWLFAATLTELAEELFPKSYDVLANRVLDSIEAESGPSGLAGLAERMAESWARDHEARLAGKSLDERVVEAAKIRSEEGAWAEVETVEDGYNIVQYNCSCPQVSGRHPEVTCAAELAYLRRLLGSDVQRVEWRQGGSRTCRYHVPTRARIPVETIGTSVDSLSNGNGRRPA